MTLFGFLTLLALSAPPAPGTAPNPTGEMIKMGLMLFFMVIVMYFTLIYGPQKKAKDHDKLLKTIKPGDRVVTNGGIVGVVLSLKDKTVSIRSADTKLEVLKSAVTEELNWTPSVNSAHIGVGD